MKTAIVPFALLLAAACAHNVAPPMGAAAPAPAGQAQAAGAEADLTTALQGRIAGAPQDCVAEADLGGNKSYGRDAIVFTGRTGDVLWVNRPASGCPALDPTRAIRVKTPASRLCRGDIVIVFDPTTKIEFGGCALGAFTPYRAAEKHPTGKRPPG